MFQHFFQTSWYDWILLSVLHQNFPVIFRQLGNNNNSVQNSLEKLSSGLQINKVADHAAGLAISEKMRGQIRGLDMAIKNSQDGRR